MFAVILVSHSTAALRGSNKNIVHYDTGANRCLLEYERRTYETKKEQYLKKTIMWRRPLLLLPPHVC